MSAGRADTEPAAYECGSGGTPNLDKKRCDCPAGKVPTRRGTKAVCSIAGYEVTIESQPSGAIVRIGTDVRVTPFTYFSKLGTLDVIAEKEGFDTTRQTFVVTKKETFLIRLPQKSYPHIKIEGDANLRDADVALDGVAKGKAPLLLGTTPGRHLVEVKKRTFETYAQWVDVDWDDVKTLTVALKPWPQIKITGTNLADAEVQLEGVKMGAGPMTISVPTPGRYYVHIKKAGFETYDSGWLELASGDVKTLAVTLKAITPPASAAACPDGMIKVPGGTFWMGANGLKEQHKVTLDAYCIDKTEVTAKQYKACVVTGACKPAATNVAHPEITDPKWRQKWASSCNADDPNRLDHPINCVDWDQARTYCDAQAKRLPSEAEWELAARGTDGREYPWGKDEPTIKLANVCDGSCGKLFDRLDETWTPLYTADDGHAATAPIGSFASGASPYGVLDMAGNVEEWVNDWYAEYTTNPQTNPQGPRGGSERVTRGGNWSTAGVKGVTTFRREGNKPHARLPTIGFRCAKTVAN